MSVGGQPKSRKQQAPDRLRELPAVDRLAAEISADLEGTTYSSAETTAVARAVLIERRDELLAGAEDEPDLLARARDRLAGSLRRVLNGTGVVIHTNLGRAPLARAAVEALAKAASGYVNLELDLGTGRRESRDGHVADLLRELTGCEDALVVNNGASAVLLAATALAGPDRAIVVSRGQLVEIGGAFRIPDVIAQSGTRLIEVGTTNRTRVDDYRWGLANGGDVVLRVHPANFRSLGYVADVPVDVLCGLDAPVIDDIGSGVLGGEVPLRSDEPSAIDSVRAGAALVCFSGDKLLGGPQAGILVGKADAVEACRCHPLMRALRMGRLPLAALCATLAIYRDPDRALQEIPVLAMLTIDDANLAARAAQLADGCGGAVVEATAKIGGGALPLLELHGPVVAIRAVMGPDALAAALRAGEPALIGRIARDAVLIDPRTLRDDEIDVAAGLVRRVLERS